LNQKKSYRRIKIGGTQILKMILFSKMKFSTTFKSFFPDLSEALSKWECTTEDDCYVLYMKQSSLKFYAKFLDEEVRRGIRMRTNEFSMAPLEKLEVGKNYKLMHIDSVLENGGTTSILNPTIFCKDGAPSSDISCEKLCTDNLVDDYLLVSFPRPLFDKDKNEISILKHLSNFSRTVLTKKGRDPNYIYTEPALYNQLYKAAITIVFFYPRYLRNFTDPHKKFLEKNLIDFNEEYNEIYKDLVHYLFMEMRLGPSKTDKIKLIGKYRYLLFLLPFIKCCDLSAFWFDSKGFYEKTMGAETDGDVIVIMEEFCKKLGMIINFYSLDTLLASLAINYQVQEVDGILKMIERHNYRNTYKENFLIFKTELKTDQKLKTLLVTKMRNYSLKSVLGEKHCYLFTEKEATFMDFAAVSTDKIQRCPLNEFPPNKMALKGDTIYLLFQRNGQAESINQLISTKFLFYLPIFQNSDTKIIPKARETEDDLKQYSTKGFIHSIFLHQILPLVHKRLQEIYLATGIQNRHECSIPEILDLLVNVEKVKNHEISREFKKLGICKEKIQEIQEFNDLENFVNETGDPFVIFHCENPGKVEFNKHFLQSFVNYEILSVYSDRHGGILLTMANGKLQFYIENKMAIMGFVTIEGDLWIIAKSRQH
jgi:hypothetical protein